MPGRRYAVVQGIQVTIQIIVGIKFEGICRQEEEFDVFGVFLQPVVIQGSARGLSSVDSEA